MGNEKTSPIGIILLILALIVPCGLFGRMALATIIPEKTTIVDYIFLYVVGLLVLGMLFARTH